jgi:hypothetical protein
MQILRTLAFVALLITCYYFVYYFYIGITHPIPAPGDSWDYHIPIAKNFLNGSFLNPHVTIVKQYFPGSSEIFNALLLFLHIPLTLSNILAIFILGICCYFLARTVKLNRYYALLFSLTIITVNAVMRWLNAVSIDVWVAIYFILLIILLEKPKKSIWYYLQLGFLSGMLIGSKYNVFIFLVVLFGVYIKNILATISFPRILVFLIPFSLFGLFWYIRNYILVHNPFYPIATLGFPGEKNFGGYLDISYTMWGIGLHYPADMLNAAFGEYKLWLLSIFIVIWALVRQFFIQKKYTLDTTTKILVIGFINFLLFLNFPTDQHPWIMVSSFRYSYPTFIPLILGVFILAAKYKKEAWIGYIAVASMLPVLSMAYYPKLLLVYLPLALLIFYFFERKKKLA